jgi:isopenicillin N synthase-like dioxygenase
MNILKVDYRAKNAAEVFAESLQKTGFGVITHHPIPVALIQSVYDDWKSFFSNKAKLNYLFDKKTQAGYFPFKSENAKDYPTKDLKEFYHIYPTESAPFPKEVSSKSLELFNELMKMGLKLLDWLDEQTPAKIRSEFSMPLSDMVKGSPKNLFRIIHYPPLSGSEESGAIRAAAHEDINIITLLPAATAMGLQVKDVAGNWYDVPGEWGDIVINVGDMLQMASQNFYKSTTHRVVNPIGEAAKLPRYSMPLFLHPLPKVRLSEKYTADSYLTERLQEIGLK